MLVANIKGERPPVKDVLANFCPDDRVGDGYGFVQDIIDALDEAGYKIVPKIQARK